LTGNSGHSVAAILQISAIVNAKTRQLDPASGDAETATLEAEIDRATDAPPPLCDFISPGEAEASVSSYDARRGAAHRAQLAALDKPPGAPATDPVRAE
jgi:cob(I)alamin adenosyltransferase